MRLPVLTSNSSEKFLIGNDKSQWFIIPSLYSLIDLKSFSES